MKRRFTTIYSVFCTLLLAAGFLLAFVFAWQAGIEGMIECIYGLIIGFTFSPMLHELGHVAFAQIANMDYVYVKFFCFKIYIKKGKKRFGFASPFAPDETQVLPKTGGNMQKRAMLYTVGGLVVEGTFMLVILAAAILLSAIGHTDHLLWGIVPYAAYLLILNVAPVEYPSGKTDTLVYLGLKKGCDAEKTMISAMEIQGRLFEGKSFSEIDENWYFDVPQLREDEPLYAVMLDLRYRYYLEKNETEKAADCLNRLIEAQAYLSDVEVEKIAAELTYIYVILGDTEHAEESGKLCREYLKSEEAAAKRILAAYAKANGKTEAVPPLVEQAEACLEKERVIGVKKFEKILLSRILQG